MKIELRSIHFSERLSEETNAFHANLYIDGVMVGTVKNDGHGGDTFVRPIPDKSSLIQKARAFCLLLPETPSLEEYADTLLVTWLKRKDVNKLLKKLEKLCVNHLVIVNPIGLEDFKQGKADLVYGMVKFKVPLMDIPKEKLLAEVNRLKSKLKPGEIFYNDLSFLDDGSTPARK